MRTDPNSRKHFGTPRVAPQWTVILKAISPADYDGAVLRRPFECPLGMAQDPRTGAQLLGLDAPRPAAPGPDGGAADLDRLDPSVAEALCCREGAAAMRRMVAAVEGMARDAEMRLRGSGAEAACPPASPTSR